MSPPEMVEVVAAGLCWLLPREAVAVAVADSIARDNKHSTTFIIPSDIIGDIFR